MSAIQNQLLQPLPESLSGLLELALDLRFSWSREADHLWRQLNADLWMLTHNPWLVLQTVSARKLQQLAADESFCQTLKSLVEVEQIKREAPRWFQKAHPDAPLTGVAYFSMEYGISEALPIYSGGLGNVAGDQFKSANDLGIPVIGVGLLYQYGYFRQHLEADGTQVALYPANNTSELPILPLRDAQGEWFRFPLDIPGHGLWVRVWQARVGRVSLYLLDTNDPVNLPADRCITTELYGGGQEQRLLQEVLLGIGGCRVLQALGLQPEVYHLNEGHAAFAVLERARQYMEAQGVSFWTALAATRAGNLFTTHTPVDAGFDRFDPRLIQRYLSGYTESLGISVAQLLSLGRRVQNDPEKPFNMAYLAIRGSGAINGVSRLHGAVSRKLFAPLFPDWAISEVPIGHVTNGIHVETWVSDASERIWAHACGEGCWLGDQSHIRERFRETTDKTLWDMRELNRQQLVVYARSHIARQLAANTSRSMADVHEMAQHCFDPNILTLGFARRFASYKRPDLLLHDPDRLVRLLTDPHHPVQIAVAGKAHPQDADGQRMIRAWYQFAQRPEVRHRVIFLQDYDMLLAERLVMGVDVWINTPRRPWEASGTSGMKILANGGLNLSELDGWWAEAYDSLLGWSIGDGLEHDALVEWDQTEAEQLYAVLEQQVVPAFYRRDSDGIPRAWVTLMRESMSRLTPQFSSHRTVREYLETYYLPMAQRYRERADGRAALASELLDWQARLGRHWSKVRFGDLRVETHEGLHLFQIPVYLGELEPESVTVQLYADAVDGDVPILVNACRVHPLAGAVNGFLYEARVTTQRAASDYTPRIVADHPKAQVPLEADQILWCK